MTHLPTNIEELEALFQVVFNKESWENGVNFQPRPSDVIISPYAKCGTTWIQQIAHGLRTCGSMDFEEITEVVPWLEIAKDIGWDLEAPQVAEPRLFKSHLNWYDIPKGSKYIVSFRHYQDAFISFYRFFEGFFFEPGSISLETLLHWRWPREEMGKKGYWHFQSSWWEQRHNPNVLLLCYEDMKADLSAAIEMIAHFMGIALDDSLREIVLHQSSREFMLKNRYHFDEKFTRRLIQQRAGLPFDASADKITPGPGNSARYQLSSALKEELDEIWREQMQEKYGFESYDDLRQAVRELNSAR